MPVSLGARKVTITLPIFAKRLSQKFDRSILRGVRRSGQAILREVRRLTPVNTRRLRRSWRMKINRAKFTASVSTRQKHGPIMEFGRRAGAKMPPIAKLIPWVKKRFSISDNKEALRAAWGLAVNIAKRGIRITRSFGMGPRSFNSGKGAMIRRAIDTLSRRTINQIIAAEIDKQRYK